MTLPDLQKKDVGGRAVAWREAGESAAGALPIVFLHGIGSASDSWAAQLDHFSQFRRAVAWDAPGYGGSDRLEPEAPSPADYAEVLDDWLSAIGIERAVIVGNSLGSLMAAGFVRRCPQRVAMLVLSDIATGHGRMDPAERVEKLSARLADVEKLGPAGMAKARAPRLLAKGADRAVLARITEIMGRIDPAGYAQAARMLSAGDIFKELAFWRGPTLVLCGAEDIITPPDQNMAVARAVPDASYREIPGAGHVPFAEAPEEFNRLIDGFLTEKQWAAA